MNSNYSVFSALMQMVRTEDKENVFSDLLLISESDFRSVFRLHEGVCRCEDGCVFRDAAKAKGLYV